MSQFDVYPNSSRLTKEAYPYLVDIQNEVIVELATRLVVPLTAMSMKPTMFMKKLRPEITGKPRWILVLF